MTSVFIQNILLNAVAVVCRLWQSAGEFAHVASPPMANDEVATAFDVRRLIGGEPLAAPLVVGDVSKVGLMMMPTQQVWLRDSTATNIWAFRDAVGAAMLDVTEGQRVRIDVRS